MCAIEANVRVESPDEARPLLPAAREALVPRAPGIVRDCWREPMDGTGASPSAFETPQPSRPLSLRDPSAFETKGYAEEPARYPVTPVLRGTQVDPTVREVLAQVCGVDDERPRAPGTVTNPVSRAHL